MRHILATLVLMLSTSAASAQLLEIEWYTVDGGGGTSSGGVFTLMGTIGQPDAGVAMTGGAFTLVGGFWAASTPACPADFDGDGFVTGLDFDAYVAAFEAGDPATDFDGDDFVTGLDFDAYVQAFETGC